MACMESKEGGSTRELEIRVQAGNPICFLNTDTERKCYHWKAKLDFALGCLTIWSLIHLFSNCLKTFTNFLFHKLFTAILLFIRGFPLCSFPFILYHLGYRSVKRTWKYKVKTRQKHSYRLLSPEQTWSPPSPRRWNDILSRPGREGGSAVMAMTLRGGAVPWVPTVGDHKLKSRPCSGGLKGTC